MILSAEERLFKWNSEEARKFIVHDIFLVLYFFVGVIGNAVVIVVYQTKLNKGSDSRYFFPFLAFFYLFACGFRAPFELWKTLLPVNFKNILGCQIVWWIVNVFTFSSIYLLAFITFQRYLKVCRPFGFQLTLTVRRCCIVGVILMAMTFASPFIIWNEKLEILNNNQLKNFKPKEGAQKTVLDKESAASLQDTCTSWLSKELSSCDQITSANLQVTLTFELSKEKSSCDQITPANLQDTCTSGLSKELSSCEQITPANLQVTSTSELSKEKSSCEEITPAGQKCAKTSAKSGTSSSENSVTRFSYMVMVISLAFVLSCIPQISLLFALSRNRYFWIETTETESIVFRFLDHMMIINNVVNPYIYGYFDLKFKHAAKEILCNCCRK